MDTKLKKKWEELYKYSKSIVKSKPWEWITEYNIIEVEAYEGLKFYLSIMGHEGMFEGIMLATSKAKIAKYLEMQDKDFPSLLGINYQEGILLIYSKREDALEENLEIADEFMKRQIAGKKVTFESFVKGYMPSPLVEEELDDAIIAFSALAAALKRIDEARKNDDKKILKMQKELLQDPMKMLHLNYDSSLDSLEMKLIELEDIIDYMMELELPEEIEKQLKKCKRVKNCYEVDFLNYLPIPVGKVKYKNPLGNESINKLNLPRIFAAADVKNGEIIDFMPTDKTFMTGQEEIAYRSFCMDQLIEIFKKNGIPERIEVRDEETYSLLESMCKSLGIELTTSGRLYIIDDFFSGFVNFVTEGEYNNLGGLGDLGDFNGFFDDYEFDDDDEDDDDEE